MMAEKSFFDARQEHFDKRKQNLDDIIDALDMSNSSESNAIKEGMLKKKAALEDEKNKEILIFIGMFVGILALMAIIGGVLLLTGYAKFNEKGQFVRVK